MKMTIRIFRNVLFLLIITVVNANAVGVTVGPDGKQKTSMLNLPFAFYNKSFGATVGYVYGVAGWPQKQSALLSTTIAGTTGSGMTFLIGRDVQVPFARRWFSDQDVSIGYFNDAEIYIDGNPDYAGESSGINDSDEDNFVEGDGWDNFFRFKLKYLLPMGHGKDTIISTYKVIGGHLIEGASGGESMNPFVSGTTFLEFKPFYRSQAVENNDVDITVKTNGLETGIYWDNRDWFANPKKGNSWRIKYSEDWGKFNSSGEWSAVEGEVDQYFSLGESTITSFFSGRILALDFWTSYSPSWDDQSDGTTVDRPPVYAGPTLGGLWRMRGYSSYRFSDRAAIYYCAELRLTLKSNPFDKWDWLQKYVGVQWVQVVPFVEVGRVASEWTMDKLHSDMKYDAGLGIRLMAKGLTVRIDVAGSDEGLATQMMIAQPFQF